MQFAKTCGLFSSLFFQYLLSVVGINSFLAAKEIKFNLCSSCSHINTWMPFNLFFQKHLINPVSQLHFRPSPIFILSFVSEKKERTDWKTFWVLKYLSAKQMGERLPDVKMQQIGQILTTLLNVFAIRPDNHISHF